MFRILLAVLVLGGCSTLTEAEAKPPIITMTPDMLRSVIDKAYQRGYDAHVGRVDAFCRKVS